MNTGAHTVWKLGQSVVRRAAFVERQQWMSAISTALLCIGCLCFVAAGRSRAHLAELKGEVDSLMALAQRNAAPGKARSPAARAQPPQPPPERQFFSDLERMYQIAGAAGIAMDEVTYRTERPAASPWVVHYTTFTVPADYGRMRQLLATLLDALPHLSLQTLRLERPDATASNGLLTCTMAFVYTAGTTATTRDSNTAAARDPFAPLNPLASLDHQQATAPGKATTGAKAQGATPPTLMAAPAPAAPAPATGPPGPPALPFTFIGSIQGKPIAAGRPVVFLKVKDSIVTASVGDTVEGAYRLQAIAPGQIELRYLPLGTAQFLHIHQ